VAENLPLLDRRANNINGIDDGYTGDGLKGIGSITMTAPNAITRIQDAYGEKVIDTLNDLPNVLWIVSEEAPADSTWWNNHQIAHIRDKVDPTMNTLRKPVGGNLLGLQLRAGPVVLELLDVLRFVSGHQGHCFAPVLTPDDGGVFAPPTVPDAGARVDCGGKLGAAKGCPKNRCFGLFCSSRVLLADPDCAS
jgi:hypothetical protein